MNKTLIIAHRGDTYDAPENTLSAINLAWERGAEAVECDVHLSKDNNIIVIHDDNTFRTTGENHKIRELNLDELKKIDAGSWHGEQWKEEPIPALEEVLDTIPSCGKLLIEIKSDHEIIPILKNILDKSGIKKEQIILMDFNYNSVCEMKKYFPGYEILLLSTMRKMKFFYISTNELIDKTLKPGLTGLNLMGQNRINVELVEKIKNSGLKLYIWTVDNPEEVKRLIDLGVDGIATNRAEWIKKELKLL
ncbi:glycerophosphodiester phosphodiesterase [Bacteroidota bacterium]